MKKRVVRAMLTGFASTVFVVLIVQLCIAQAGHAVVTPGFAARFSNESAAVLAQLGLVGLIGMAFAGGAQVFEIESWSFLRQGAVHFLITAAVWMPVAGLCWTPVPPEALWGSVAGWLGTYGITWTIQYFLWRRKVREVNRSIRRYQHERD